MENDRPNEPRKKSPTDWTIVVFIAALVVNVVGFYGYGMYERLILGLNHPTDFDIVFRLAVQRFLENPTTIYDNQLNEYRNLPSLVLFHLVFNYPGSSSNWALVSQSMVIIFANLGTCIAWWESWKLLESRGKTNRFSPFLLMAGVLLPVWHYFEYVNGHTHALAGFFLSTGIYFMLREKLHFTFFLWSIALIFKLNPIMWIFFFIFTSGRKELVKNLSFAIGAQAPTIIMFLAWPGLITGFLESNVGFSLERAPIVYPVSGTLPRELAYALGVPVTGIALAFMAVLVPLAFLVLEKGNFGTVDKLVFVALVTITVVPDFVNAHVLYLIPLYMLWLSQKHDAVSLPVKIVPFFPTMFFLPWRLFVFKPFPFVSLFYFIPLVIILYRQVAGLDLAVIVGRFFSREPKNKSGSPGP